MAAYVDVNRLRLAELVGALSLATDLGMGQPLEQALRTCLIALAIADRLGLDAEAQAEVYYVSLLRFLGCTADAHDMAALVGGDEIAVRAAIAPVLGGAGREFVTGVMPQVGRGQPALRRARLVAGMMVGGREQIRGGLRAHCELAENLALRLGLPVGVRAALASAFEQWSGEGLPNGLAGEAIPLAARIVFVARDIEVLQRQAGAEQVRSALGNRRGNAYDPAVADVATRYLADLVAMAEVSSPWQEVLRLEPEPRPWIPEGRLEAVLEVFADFVDLKSPFTAGHSREVARLVGPAAGDDSSSLRRAALLHDLGRVSVPNGIWDKPGPLTDGEWERVRLHPYYTERILGRVTALSDLATIAGMHHERVDGSGYHRGSARAEIPLRARLLAAADVYQAMTQPRPHRPARTGEQAADELRRMAAAGRLDREAVDGVLDSAGHETGRVPAAWPAGLSEREVEVLRLICRGGTKKEVARALSISPSTVDHHVRHIYEKAGVQSRAGATLFALEHDLLR
jgi:HD-GYP domain-containing protein (c-di-GMP phosphodiesterase class II)/DNA-binding CsgD family transcriptional regulator